MKLLTAIGVGFLISTCAAGSESGGPPAQSNALVLATTSVSVASWAEPAVLQIRLEPAVRYVDSDYWCGGAPGVEKVRGHLWAVVTRKGRPATVTDLTRLLSWSEETWFYPEPFTLYLSDINRDGTSEFTLGEYGTCTGWVYLLLTLSKSGAVVLFPAPPLYVAATGSSIPLDVEGDGYTYCENSVPEGYTCVKVRRKQRSGAYQETSRKPGCCK